MFFSNFLPQSLEKILNSIILGIHLSVIILIPPCFRPILSRGYLKLVGYLVLQFLISPVVLISALSYLLSAIGFVS